MATVDSLVTRRQLLLLLTAQLGISVLGATAKKQARVPSQVYFAEVLRAVEKMKRMGRPPSAADSNAIRALVDRGDSAAMTASEQILNRYTFLHVDIDAEGTVQLATGGADRVLIEQGWQLFLLQISNGAQRTGAFNFTSGGRSGLSGIVGSMTPGHIGFEPATNLQSTAQQSYLFDTVNKAPLIEGMWLTSSLEDAAPLPGGNVEYRVIQLCARNRGKRSATMSVFAADRPCAAPDASSGHTDIEFVGIPSNDVALGTIDADGRPCVASVTIKDRLERIYPPQAMRLAPDLPFQPQIYRADGETVRLPGGEYVIEGKRGPEYLPTFQSATVSSAQPRIEVRLQRWIDSANWGWYSGDTHILAAGCAHYHSPTEGVSPETIIRQVRGEGLSIGDVLTWGPGWYYQKQFFTGRAESPAATLEHPDLQLANSSSMQPRVTIKDHESVIRYDVKISGFPSSHAGYLVLLRLRGQEFPGTRVIEDWPSWNLPVLKWAKEQGANMA